MDRLIFIVEGESEAIFINNYLIPYLGNKHGWNMVMTTQKITTNRVKKAKGGNVGYQYFKNEIKSCARPNHIFITTLLDFFRLPNDFPAFTTNSKLVDKIEEAICKDIANEGVIDALHFFPYIQVFEFEALMFSNEAGLRAAIKNDRLFDKIIEIQQKYPNPENINNGPQTAPSKRLEKIYNYRKTIDTRIVFNKLSIDEIREKCPRFNSWVDKLELLVSNASEK